MKVTKDILKQRMDQFRAACEQRELKVTHQRIEIYRELASTEDHPDAENIYKAVKRRIPTISLDTVYRNLKLLADEDVISVVGISNERLRFDANMGRHHHFVCVKCGVIRDFDAESIGPLEPPPEAEAFGTAHSLHLEVKGVCLNCLGKERR